MKESELTLEQKVKECWREKRCPKCKIVKDLKEFGPDRKATDGKRCWCKECHRECSRLRYAKNPEQIKGISERWQKENPEKAREAKKLWQKSHRQKTRESSLKWNKANPDRVREKSRIWAKNNPEKRCETSRLWRKNNPEKYLEVSRRANTKIRSTENGKLNHRMSSSIGQSLHGNKSGRHWETLVGYTCVQLREHLENNFSPGMSWDNLGQWNIDHIIPKSVFHFNTVNDIDFKRCWALSNLQPLWEKENKNKWAKLNHPFQPALAMGY